MASLLDSLVCPLCQCTLERDGSTPSARPLGFACTSCRAHYPSVGGIPCVVRDPDDLIATWRTESARFHADTRATCERVLAELAKPSLSDRTRGRLRALHRGLERQAETILDVLRPAGLFGTGMKADVGLPSRLLLYYEPLLRDWAWDGREHEAALAAVLDVVRAHGTLGGTMLVLGSGGSRLSYAIHRELGLVSTLALDLDPLAFLVAERVTRGETVTLVELPGMPARADAVAIERTFASPWPPRAGFELVFADALAPPLADGSASIVLTPWFIDQVPRDALAFAASEVWRVLEPGGVWLNHGPLIYDPIRTAIAHRYCSDELLEGMGERGFEVTAVDTRRLTYLQSPVGTQGRTETVLSFTAVKREQRGVVPEGEPAWLRDRELPIPPWPGLARYVAPHPLFGAVAKLVDGQRSIRAIAEVLVRHHGVPAGVAERGVEACLREILRTSA